MLHDDIKKWKQLLENADHIPLSRKAELLIQDPRLIGNFNQIDTAIWKNYEVKKSVLGFILKTLKSQNPHPALDVYFKLLVLYCPWPDLDVVKKYLTDMSIASPDRILEYFETTKIKNKEVIQQKIYEIVFEWLKKHNSNISDMIKVDSYPSSSYWKSTSTPKSAFSNDYYNVRIRYNRWIFELYEKELLPPNALSLVETYADLIIDAYEQAIKQYSGIDYSYNLDGIKTLKNYGSDPDKLNQLLYKQVSQLYQYLNSKNVVNYINSIKDQNFKKDEMERLGKLIVRVLDQLNK
jgi:hypothetical protein